MSLQLIAQLNTSPITLRPARRGTEMAYRHERFFDQAARDRHEDGWTGSFVKLERHLAEETK